MEEAMIIIKKISPQTLPVIVSLQMNQCYSSQFLDGTSFQNGHSN